MKKIIPSFLLSILASSTLLLAQAQNRLEVRGDRLEALSREQGTGYRVQVADNRKAELGSEDYIGQQANITTNCQLPTANCDNSAESLNCYLIGQRAEITTNYELRTNNCNNQGNDLDCYLMMNPEELDNLEAEIVALGEMLGGRRTRAIPSGISLGATVALQTPVERSPSGVTSAINGTPEESSTIQFIESGLNHNIDQSVLTNVERMSLAERASDDISYQNAQELAAAEQGANIAEVKEIATSRCGNRWEDQKDRTNEIIERTRNRVWPSVSQAMREFIDHPSITRMAAAREAISAAAVAHAYAYSYATAYPAVYTFVYSHQHAYASASAYPSAVEAAYSACLIAASGAASASAVEAREAVEAVRSYFKASRTAACLAESYNVDADIQGNINWLAHATREVALFARAVVSFKTEQEAREGRSATGWRISTEVAEVKALVARPCGGRDSDRLERTNAIMALIRNIVWPRFSQTMQEFIDHPSATRMVAAQEAAVASAYAAASASVFAADAAAASGGASAAASAAASTTAYASAAASASIYASANATAAEAAEAVETAGIFVKASESAAAMAIRWGVNTASQENIEWSLVATRKAAEFARAVAIFKGAMLP